jgi:hypothetical protein
MQRMKETYCNIDKVWDETVISKLVITREGKNQVPAK